MMAKWGKFDFSEFEAFVDRFQKALDNQTIDRFIRDFLLEMAFRGGRKIKKRTPVGVYPAGSGRTGGNLRRNWRVGNVEKHGDAYVVEIYNNTEYASFVEYGHRAGKNSVKWVEGRFMMTISMQEIERELPRYLDKRMAELLNNIMNGR
jgi:hypothetical protein